MAHVPPMASSGSLTGPAKLGAVTRLMDKLSEDLTAINLLPHQRDSALEELKVYGRDPKDADPIFTKQGIETLTRHAFNSPSSTTSRNALRVLCNAMLLKPETRQMFVDLGYEAKACSKLKNDNRDDEFLISRILFLTTYGTNIDLVSLIEKHHLAESIVQNLERHAKAAGQPKTNPMEDMALVETLKLLFNVTKFCSDHVDAFAAAIPHILTILCKLDLPTTKTPLDPPFGPAINALMNLKLESRSAQASLCPRNEPTSVADWLIQLLDLAMKSYGESEVEHTVTPLICVISSIHEHGPESVRQHIRTKLLPTEQDRQDVLGRGHTLPAMLLRSSTNALAPELRKAMTHLFFDMSDKDASKFVNNVGYGFASGFLFQNQIPIPRSASEAFSAGSGSAGRPVNPVTGQFLDAENFPDMPEMSEEEKEREAERLFVLFERLRANGSISVENPVRQAVQSGRFEELSDSDDDAAKDLD